MDGRTSLLLHAMYVKLRQWNEQVLYVTEQNLHNTLSGRREVRRQSGNPLQIVKHSGKSHRFLSIFSLIMRTFIYLRLSKTIQTFSQPDGPCLVVFGGYPCFAVACAASQTDIQTDIHTNKQTKRKRNILDKMQILASNN